MSCSIIIEAVTRNGADKTVLIQELIRVGLSSQITYDYMIPRDLAVASEPQHEKICPLSYPDTN